MQDTYDIVGYARISVDEELDRDNTSIENQKSIITEFVRQKFPGSTLTFFEDRDRSGYTFEQREGYQAMRPGLMSHKYNILVVKDFSRFSRRNSRGLVELEDLRDAGVRIISIGDSIDYPTCDDWTAIQFRFLVNEMPVTDASKKVRSVIKSRQSRGEWICAAPYGYLVNGRGQIELVPVEAEIVRKIYSLYIDGWGYKRIANYLTDEGVPTPRMSERERKEAAGEDFRRPVKPVWSIVTVQGILDNDFYIGTLRQGKYTRKKINGSDMKRDEGEHLVFEHHHQPVVDYRTFATVRAMREKRKTFCYRGVKRYDNTYSGLLFCGDCGSPMFALSRPDLREAYTCGSYHRRGRKACTSHHIRADRLDALVKQYIRTVVQTSGEMLEQLNRDLEKEETDLTEGRNTSANLEELILQLQEELKITKRQRVRDVLKHPEQEAVLEQTYDEMEAELAQRITGLQHQLELTVDKQNTIIRVNRAAKLAMELFEEILSAEKLRRSDLELLVKRITVYEDHIDIRFQQDIDSLLRCGTLPDDPSEESAEAVAPYPCSRRSDSNEGTFNSGTKNISNVTVVQSSEKRPDKVFCVNVISDGDPLEIYTEKDGEVIFKKYSPMGELSDLAGQICDTLGKTAGCGAAITDRDSIIAVHGAPKRDLLEKPISPQLEKLMEERRLYLRQPGEQPVKLTEAAERYGVGVSVPILSEGDLMGSVVFFVEDDRMLGEVEFKLAQTVSGFLGKQMEN